MKAESIPDPATHDIVLVALNARWSHASLALRCLHANLGPLQARAVMLERTLEERPIDVVDAILRERPRVVGLSVYIWNATEMLAVARLLRALEPQLCIVVGGPEVSHEVEDQELCRIASHVVRGEGEVAFRALCERVLADKPTLALVPAHVIDGGSPELSALAWPYALYSDNDLAHRVVYVEASRGCPFTCEFCLSSLDEKVRAFPLEPFLAQMQALFDRGLRTFKFIDRTFNLKIETAARILEFFWALQERLQQAGEPPLFVHFEMVPDRLPEALRALLARFPPGAVQLEVGVQTLNDDVGARIRRKQNVAKLEDNLRFLHEHTGIHVHADLIVGLPGEDLVSFGRGYDRLHALSPDEIQVGILKRLRGAPIDRHTGPHQMVYAPEPPYEVLRTDALTFDELMRLKRFARAHDLVVNSGRFPRAVALLMTGPSAFQAFLAFSDWLTSVTTTRHGIALSRLADLLSTYLIEQRGCARVDVQAALEQDVGRDKLPAALLAGLPPRQRRHSQSAT